MQDKTQADQPYCDESGVGFGARLAKNSTPLWSRHSILRSDETYPLTTRLLKNSLKVFEDNGTKYFATADLLETAKDRSWLVKMTSAINTHWQKQNGKKCRPVDDSQNGHSRPAFPLTVGN